MRKGLLRTGRHVEGGGDSREEVIAGTRCEIPQHRCRQNEGSGLTKHTKKEVSSALSPRRVNGSSIRGVCLTPKELGQTETRIMSWKVFPLLIACLNTIDEKPAAASNPPQVGL